MTNHPVMRPGGMSDLVCRDTPPPVDGVSVDYGMIFSLGRKKGIEMIDQILAYESGELSGEATIELFQELVSSGLAWQLQGHYGRVASALIEEGLVQA